jgi:hypothetical protein
MSTLASWTEARENCDESPIMRLYNRLDAMYPHRWRSAFAEPKSIAVWAQAWAEAFVEEGIDAEMIRDALTLCRKRFDWPPSLTDFLACCKPQQADAYTAFLEAVQQMPRRAQGGDGWSHPAVYWAASDFGAYELQHAAWDTAKGRWKAIYERRLAEPELPAVPAPMVALPPSSAMSATPEQAEEARAKVADLVNCMRAVDRQWSNRILARHARGEFVSMAVLKSANTAKERLRV